MSDHYAEYKRRIEFHAKNREGAHKRGIELRAKAFVEINSGVEKQAAQKVQRTLAPAYDVLARFLSQRTGNFSLLI